MIEVGTIVRYSKQKWQVTEITGSLALVENEYDVRAVPLSSLKEVKK